MIDLIASHSREIEMLCAQCGVRRLAVFGSAVRGELRPASDIDFVVTFLADDPAGSFERYFSLKEGLEAILARRVDLVVEGAVKNPVFRSELARTKQPVYAAA